MLRLYYVLYTLLSVFLSLWLFSVQGDALSKCFHIVVYV